MQLEFMGGNKASEDGLNTGLPKVNFKAILKKTHQQMIPLYFPSFFFFLASEKYVDYFHLFGFCDVVFQTGLESQGWHTCTFLQFTLDKCYNKILQFFYFLHKIASETSIVSNLEFDMKGTEHFFTVFSCYMYCVDLYVSKTFVYVYLCCYSQKRFIIWKENQIILSCALLQSRRRCWVPRPTHKRELAEADATVIDCTK